MNGLTSLDAVYIALVLVVPGYVFTSLRGHLVAGRRSSGPDYFVGLFTISAVNFALFGWSIYLAISYGYGPIPRAILWTAVILVCPAVLGLVCGICTQRQFVKWLYGKLGLKPIHVTPTAWDHKFSTSNGEWVLVTLKDGTEFAGWWGAASFSSSEPSERDVLIETVYETTDDGPWEKTNKSVLIAAGEIRAIEFIQAS